MTPEQIRKMAIEYVMDFYSCTRLDALMLYGDEVDKAKELIELDMFAEVPEVDTSQYDLYKDE